MILGDQRFVEMHYGLHSVDQSYIHILSGLQATIDCHASVYSFLMAAIVLPESMALVVDTIINIKLERFVGNHLMFEATLSL